MDGEKNQHWVVLSRTEKKKLKIRETHCANIENKKIFSYVLQKCSKKTQQLTQMNKQTTQI